MSVNLPRLIDAFARLKVLVIGEAMLDSYLEGHTGRICREAPVPIVNVQERKDAPGGAANTAVNLCSLGAKVQFLSVIGDDIEATLLKHALRERGISTNYILTHPQRRTLAKHRVVASSQMLVRFDQGDTAPLNPEIEQALLDRLAELFPRVDAVVVSDYGYGILTERVIKLLAELQASYPRIVVADAKYLPVYKEVGLTAVKPNYEETVHLLGLRTLESGPERVAQVAEHGAKVLELTGAKIAALTVDTEGAFIFEQGKPEPHRIFAKPASNSRAAGAGDTFVSALTLALAAKADTNTAAELAAAAAAIVVGKDGTVACSSKELRELFAVDDAEASDLDQLAARVEFYRQQGNRIILTTGIFDILHPGHITFLNRAKALGDVLIVGVNSDESTRRLKGPDRPINCLQDRLQVLNALSCIDHLVAFEEDMPDEVIRAIHPDVFVKGGTYSRETLPEAALVEELGGAVQILPYLNDRSTSGIIEYIRDAFAQAVEPPTPKKATTRRKDEAAIREAYGWPSREQRGEAL